MRRGDLDSDRRYFRSETRVLNLNGSWYFATREGDQGPYFNRVLAESEAVRYAYERESLCGFQASREAGHVARPGARRNLSIVPMEETAPLAILALESD